MMPGVDVLNLAMVKSEINAARLEAGAYTRPLYSST